MSTVQHTTSCSKCGRAIEYRNKTGLCVVHLREETARKIAALDRRILAELNMGRSRRDVAAEFGVGGSAVDRAARRLSNPAISLPKRRLVDVIAAASTCAGLGDHELRGRSKLSRIIKARQAVALIGMEAGYSSTVVGRSLGKRDHSTILHGREAAQRRAAQSPEYAAYLDAVRAGSTRGAKCAPVSAAAIVEAMSLPRRGAAARRRMRPKNDF
jgi:chromosomal replication initiation ATPase DnaA